MASVTDFATATFAVTGRCSASELHELVRVIGFEPTASCAQDMRATTALHPDNKRTPAVLAGANRIERLLLGLESSVLPLHQAPICGVIILLRLWSPKFHNFSIANRPPAASTKGRYLLTLLPLYRVGLAPYLRCWFIHCCAYKSRCVIPSQVHNSIIARREDYLSTA